MSNNFVDKLSALFVVKNGSVSVTSIANAGVLVSSKKTKVLIDALQTGKEKVYTATEEKTLENIKEGKDIFKGLDILMFTHMHPDHFNPQITCETLNNNELLQLIAPQSVVDMLKDQKNYDPQCASRLWPMNVKKGSTMQLSLRGINIEISCVEHDTYEKSDTPNDVFMFTIDKKTFVHVGDAKASVKNFEGTALFGRKIDMMFVPFTFVGMGDGRELISKIAPKKLVIMHLPAKENDVNKWASKAKLAYDKNAATLPPAVFFENPGQQITV